MLDTYSFEGSYYHLRCKDNWCEWANIIIILSNIFKRLNITSFYCVYENKLKVVLSFDVCNNQC